MKGCVAVILQYTLFLSNGIADYRDVPMEGKLCQLRKEAECVMMIQIDKMRQEGCCMGRRWRLITGIVSCGILLPLLVYCLLRFSFGVDLLDRGGWDTKEGQVRYLDYYGKPQLQWQVIEGNTYYFTPDDGCIVTGWLDLDGKCYYLDEAGAMVTGWQDLDGKRYYFDAAGAMVIGWLDLDGERYFLDETGAAVAAWHTIAETRYYFSGNGAMTTGWLVLEKGRYYFDRTGAMTIGWLDLDGQRYYLDEAGIAVTGWQKVENKQRYFDETGAMVTGWLDLDGKRYYLDTDGVPVTGWAEVEEKRYFFDDSGCMVTGWLEQDNDRYYLREDGSMAVGEVVIEGTSHFFTSKGKYVLLVNRWHFMPEDYVPDLVYIEGFQVDSSCRDALEQMLVDCRKAGYRCEINNTYRTVAMQEDMWEVRIKKWTANGMSYDEAVEYIGRELALPRGSEHNLGLAVDITGSDAMYDWLGEHCWDYGFILRYPDDRFEITGIVYEPWHFRYVGTELAKELQTLGLCMEEYMDMLTQATE